MAKPSAALIDPATLSLMAKEIVDVSKDSLKALDGYHLVLSKVPSLMEEATISLKLTKIDLDNATFRIKSAWLRMDKARSFAVGPDPLINLDKSLRDLAASERSFGQHKKELGDANKKFLEAESKFQEADMKVKCITDNAKATAEAAIKKTSDAVTNITERLADVVPQVPQVVEHSSGFGHVILFLGGTLVLFVGAFYVGRWSTRKK